MRTSLITAACVAAAGGAGVLAACAGERAPAEPAAVLQLDSLTAPWQDTAAVHVRSRPSDGSSITWAVADTAVATIDQQGIVTGRRGGATVVTARAGNQTATAPLRVEMRFVKIAVAARTSCGLVRQGQWMCWGNNNHGWIVYPFGSDARWPIDPGLRPFTEIDGGGTFTVGCNEACGQIVTGPYGEALCGLLANGRLDCWGSSAYGLTPLPYFVPKPPPVQVITDSMHVPAPISSFSVGIYHGCAIDTSGVAYCWGININSQLGTPASAPPTATGCMRSRTAYFACSFTPIQVETSLRFRQIAAGFTSTCAISVDARAWCWGASLQPGTPEGATPALVSLPSAARSITAGATHACAITTDGAGYCWGRNDHGQLGIGAVDTSMHAPTPVATSLRFTRIVGRLDTECAIATTGALYCWGANTFGQIGDGSATDRGAPTATHLSEPVLDVRLSDNHACALASSGADYCWGVGDYGQLGNGSPQGSSLPLKVITPP